MGRLAPPFSGVNKVLMSVFSYVLKGVLQALVTFVNSVWALWALRKAANLNNGGNKELLKEKLLQP